MDRELVVEVRLPRDLHKEIQGEIPNKIIKVWQAKLLFRLTLQALRTINLSLVIIVQKFHKLPTGDHLKVRTPMGQT